MARLPHRRTKKYISVREKKRERILQERRKKAAVKAKPLKQEMMRKKPKPITTEEVLKRSRQEVNNTNRRRAKTMEREVAKFLRGKRVPASGAMMGMKGDCEIPLLNGGHYFVECKMSANEDRHGNKKIVLSLAWFNKVLKDAKAMNAKFGVLVIHFFRCTEDYVFVPSSAILWLAPRSNFEEALENTADIRALDIRFVKDRQRSVYGLYLDDLQEMLVDVNGIKAASFLMSSGYWYVFTLTQFRDLLEGI